jgi:hypothetical protein
MGTSSASKFLQNKRHNDSPRNSELKCMVFVNRDSSGFGGRWRGGEKRWPARAWREGGGEIFDEGMLGFGGERECPLIDLQG